MKYRIQTEVEAVQLGEAMSVLDLFELLKGEFGDATIEWFANSSLPNGGRLVIKTNGQTLNVHPGDWLAVDSLLGLRVIRGPDFEGALVKEKKK